MGIVPLPGDYVEFNVLNSDRNEGNILSIKKRKNELIRPAIANVDFLIIVAAIKNPFPDFYLIDKMLASAEHKNIEPFIIVNKMDLDSDGSFNEINQAYSKAGYFVLPHSMYESSKYSGLKLEEILKTKYKGAKGALAGQSGVGKSTILNNVLGMEVLKTGDLSVRTEHGKHTTRHAELIMIDGGIWIADTPGFSTFEDENIVPSRLSVCYPEIWNNAKNCRFTGCMHDSEPDCGVKDAVDRGIIDRMRYIRYISLLTELKNKKRDYGE